MKRVGLRTGACFPVLVLAVRPNWHWWHFATCTSCRDKSCRMQSIFQDCEDLGCSCKTYRPLAICRRYILQVNLICALAAVTRLSTSSGGIREKFVPTLSVHMSVHGGDPTIQSGQSSSCLRIASLLSLFLVKSHGSPLGFFVRRSRAANPVMLREAGKSFAASVRPPLPYSSWKVTGVLDFMQEHTNLVASTGLTPLRRSMSTIAPTCLPSKS